MTKDELRARMKAARRSIPHEQLISSSRRIAELLFETEAFKNARTIMLYMSSFNEPKTDDILARVLETKRAVIPVSDTGTHTIIPSLIRSEYDLIKGSYGIREPRSVVPVAIDEIDAALIPGSAFDRSGGRLGFGAGYYDRFLSEFQGVRIGICHDFQLLPSVPQLPHDAAMDMIITEKRVYYDF